jgi:YD repeat-containing protein
VIKTCGVNPQRRPVASRQTSSHYAVHLIASITDDHGLVTTYGYNATGRLTRSEAEQGLEGGHRA